MELCEKMCAFGLFFPLCRLHDYVFCKKIAIFASS